MFFQPSHKCLRILAIQVLVADTVNAPITKELLAAHARKDTLAVRQTVGLSACSAPTALHSWPASSRSALILASEFAGPMLSAKWLTIGPSALARQSSLAILLLVATSQQVETSNMPLYL